jgi:hypothetical protein
MHVDDFIDSHEAGPAYARWILLHFRMPACMQIDFQSFIKDRLLFCNWKDKRYRVTGASRLGDIFLCSNFQKDSGYDVRVDPNECTNWGPSPLGR